MKNIHITWGIAIIGMVAVGVIAYNQGKKVAPKGYTNWIDFLNSPNGHDLWKAIDSILLENKTLTGQQISDKLNAE